MNSGNNGVSEFVAADPKNQNKGMKTNNFAYVIKQTMDNSRQLLVGNTLEEEQFLFDSLNSNAYPQVNSSP